MTSSIIVACLTVFGGLVVWFVKLILLERYQFMDKIAGEKLPGPYVMIRLDRLTGEVDAFNWAGWIRVKPHSGYEGTEAPKTTGIAALKKVVSVAAVLFLILVAVAIWGLARHPSGNTSADGVLGRYQMVPVEYDSIQAGSVAHTKSVLKVDTQTGQVWQWTLAPGPDGKVTQTWTKTD